ncbi:hypothetical protein HYE13_03860 [Mycoplasmopsis bovis]|nr:hypothetical protein [Mycoplasmopsis bovis]QQH25922.1 hypothetical protein HYE13_03860 [Mycoplasmopsis bovis]
MVKPKKRRSQKWKPKLSETKTTGRLGKVQGWKDKSNKEKIETASKKQTKVPTLKDKELNKRWKQEKRNSCKGFEGEVLKWDETQQ